MTGDRWSRHARTGRPLVGTFRDKGHLGSAGCRDLKAVGQPCQQTDERVQRRLARLGGVVVTDDADQLAETLVTAGGVSSHRVTHAAEPSLPDPTVSIDQEVVGDVVPALLQTGVKVVETAEDPRRVGPRVTVA